MWGAYGVTATSMRTVEQDRLDAMLMDPSSAWSDLDYLTVQHVQKGGDDPDADIPHASMAHRRGWTVKRLGRRYALLAFAEGHPGVGTAIMREAHRRTPTETHERSIRGLVDFAQVATVVAQSGRASGTAEIANRDAQIMVAADPMQTFRGPRALVASVPRAVARGADNAAQVAGQIVGNTVGGAVRGGAEALREGPWWTVPAMVGTVALIGTGVALAYGAPLTRGRRGR